MKQEQVNHPKHYNSHPALSYIAGAPSAETVAVSAASPAEYDKNTIHFL